MGRAMLVKTWIGAEALLSRTLSVLAPSVVLPPAPYPSLCTCFDVPIPVWGVMRPVFVIDEAELPY